MYYAKPIRIQFLYLVLIDVFSPVDRTNLNDQSSQKYIKIIFRFDFELSTNYSLTIKWLTTVILRDIW